MHNSSTILTVGTALRHAQDGGAQVHVLVGGFWMSGLVLGIDGEGAVLRTSEGDTTVVRIQAITAVRVESIDDVGDLTEDLTENWAEEQAQTGGVSTGSTGEEPAHAHAYDRGVARLRRMPQPA